MRTLLHAAACLAVATAAARAQGTTSPDSAARRSRAAATAAERALFRVEDDWTRALVRRDAAAFRRLTAPGWVYTDERGVTPRDQAITEFTTGPDTVEAASNEEMRAHVYGSTAVVTGILVTRGRGANGPTAHRYRYTDTWILRGGQWRCVASQDYDIPPEARQ